jgi:hypothetical protein
MVKNYRGDFKSAKKGKDQLSDLSKKVSISIEASLIINIETPCTYNFIKEKQQILKHKKRILKKKTRIS